MHKIMFEAHHKNDAKNQTAIPSKVGDPLLHLQRPGRFPPSTFFSPFNFLPKPSM